MARACLAMKLVKVGQRRVVLFSKSVVEATHLIQGALKFRQLHTLRVPQPRALTPQLVVKAPQIAHSAMQLRVSAVNCVVESPKLGELLMDSCVGI
mmetsp:Transcript_94922/g.178588  ORF Transcript_94922/g.178588 Transcript_94922/m.178588 type:complete len:96 (+) Transcript_94922:439-726(+)